MESYREELKNITITQYVIDFKEVKIIGDHAYEWGEFHHKYFTKDNPGKELEQKGRLMRILRRLPDGQWKVARAIWTE
jgi:ketosteroid isomerase-like protein